MENNTSSICDLSIALHVYPTTYSVFSILDL